MTTTAPYNLTKVGGGADSALTYVTAPTGYGQQLYCTNQVGLSITAPDFIPLIHDDWTFEGRFTPLSTPPLGTTQNLCCVWDLSSNFSSMLVAAGNDGKITFVVSGFPSFTTPGAYTDQLPHTFAVVVTGGILRKIFVDGALLSSQSGTYAAAPNASVQIGCGKSLQSYTVGYLDEFAFSNVAQYSTAYTPATAPFPAVRSGQVALWHLDGHALDLNGPTIVATPSAPTIGQTVVGMQLVGTGTSWVASPTTTFTYHGNTGGSVANVNVTDATHATLDFYAGNTTGFSWITNNADRSQVFFFVLAAVSGTITKVVTPTGVTLTSTVPTGGTPPYAYQWHWVSDPGSVLGPGTQIPGATGLSLVNDARASASAVSYYALQTTDAAANTVFSPLVPVQLEASFPDLVFGIIADSIGAVPLPGPYTWPFYFRHNMQACTGFRNVSVVNGASIGTYTSSWLPGGVYYSQTVLGHDDSGTPVTVITPVYGLGADAVLPVIPVGTFIGQGVTDVIIQLGVNDAHQPSPVAAGTYQTNLATIIARLKTDLVGTLRRIWLAYPTFVVPGSAGVYPTSSISLLVAYQSAINALVDNVSVFLGTTEMFMLFSQHPEWLATDGIHPSTLGVAALAEHHASAIARGLGLSGGASGNVFPSGLAGARASGLVLAGVR